MHRTYQNDFMVGTNTVEECTTKKTRTGKWLAELTVPTVNTLQNLCKHNLYRIKIFLKIMLSCTAKKNKNKKINRHGCQIRLKRLNTQVSSIIRYYLLCKNGITKRWLTQ